MEYSPLVNRIPELAVTHGGLAAYTFVDYSGDLSGRRQTLTWAEVDRHVRSVAAELACRLPPGGRAAVLAPQGLEYVIAMLGAFTAQVVAIPLFTPDLPGHGDRLCRIIADARPDCVLTTAAAATSVARFLSVSGHPTVEVMTVDLDRPADPADLTGPADRLVKPPAPGDIAYLQYTSGSTRDPAGVMITHGCLAANAAQIIAGLDIEHERSVAVGWLPLFHDMGFVMTVAMPIAVAGQGVFMDPAAFLMRPVRWLELASEHTGVFTAGPNFAYDYCTTRIGDGDKAGLDLRGVRAFLNGAEPVRPATLRGFTDAFRSRGFSLAAMTPAYGLAEATVYVASGRPGQEPKIVAFARRALQRGDAVALDGADLGSEAPYGVDDAIVLAACGRPAGQQVAVVDPVECDLCPPGRVGEIWVHGPNVAPGYFRAPRAPRNGELSSGQGSGSGTFGGELRRVPGGLPRRGGLRTGDLGVLYDGELFITGRLKDLIVVDGTNHYPQDVEATVHHAHPVIRRDRVAAFAVEAAAGERVVVVAERTRESDRDQIDAAELTRAVRAAVSARHGIRLHDFLLVEPGTVPRTSSGKIARSACRERYLAGMLARFTGAAAPGEQREPSGRRIS
jgi:fatty acid CoA ligase FadD32